MPERSDAILVVIPAWNEEAVLGAVLREVGEVLGGGADVLVVSDGSTDSTANSLPNTCSGILTTPN